MAIAGNLSRIKIDLDEKKKNSRDIIRGRITESGFIKIQKLACKSYETVSQASKTSMAKQQMYYYDEWISVIFSAGKKRTRMV